jgi:hypothetical protein
MGAARANRTKEDNTLAAFRGHIGDSFSGAAWPRATGFSLAWMNEEEGREVLRGSFETVEIGGGGLRYGSVSASSIWSAGSYGAGASPAI